MINEIMNFGSNNLTCGMELVVVHCDDLKELMYGGMNGLYWLNPSAEWANDDHTEVYAVKGTASQHAEFANKQRNAIIAKRLIAKFGIDTSTVNIQYYRGYEQAIRDMYRDWWETV